MTASHLSTRRPGHRILPHTADLILEAWARDRNSCIEQAVLALVGSFVDSHDVAPAASSTGRMPAAEDAERLVAVLEEAIYIVDTRGAVPVRATITDEPDGGLLAVFELVPLGQAEVIGPARRASHVMASSSARAEVNGAVTSSSTCSCRRGSSRAYPLTTPMGTS
jgi:SHS2 domain-containing protein